MTQKDSQSSSLSLERFATLVEAYGAAPDRWPDDEREAAQQLVASSAQARELLDREAALDHLLQFAPEVSPSAQLRQKVLADAPASDRGWTSRFDEWTRSLWPFGPRWQPATALVAAAALGILTGTVSLGGPEPPPEPQELTELAFGTDDEWSETP